MLVHLVGHSHAQVPLADPAAAWRMWLALRRAFPRVWAACLVPNGVHLVADVSEVVAARHRLARVLAWHSRRTGQKRVWTPVPYPETISVRRQLLRHVREVHLRPCRAGLTPDPLSWPWSTHRGLMSAELEPWVSAALLDEIGWKAPDFALHLHEYTSTDPDVSQSGTEPPVAAAASEIPRVPLEVICRAALSATPWSRTALRRRLSVLLAYQQGWTSIPLLSRALGLSRESVRRLARGPEPRLIRAAALCLGDPRMLFDSATARALATPLDALARAPEGRCRRSSEPTCRARAPRPTSPESSSSASARSSTAGAIRSSA
jgi:hypothetical protein